MKRILFVLLMNAIHILCYSQKEGREKIDSLFTGLSTAKEDTSKVNTLSALAIEFRYSNTDTALYFTKAALALSEKLNYEMGIADAKMKISAVYASQGKFNDGLEYGNDALARYNKLIASASASEKDKILAKIGRTYVILGHNSSSQGNYPEALKNTLIALRIKEQLGDKGGISTTQFNLGIIYSLQHNYSEALNHYYASVKICEELGDTSGIASAYSAIGWLYIQQGNYQEALKNCSVALKLAEARKDSVTLAEIYNNLGLIYNHQGNYNEALKFDFAALRLYKESGIDQQLPDIYNNIGLVYMKQKKYNDASFYFDKALSFAKKIGSLELIRWSYENWAALDSIQGNNKKALEDYKLAIFYRDSLFNKEKTKKLVQQQMQYDFDKKEAATKAEQDKKDALTQAEIKKQKIIRNSVSGGLAVVILFSLVVYRQRDRISKEKKRSDELLLNILPEETAEGLKVKGSADAKSFDEVTVMFTDFKNFTQTSEKMNAKELVSEINYLFSEFDKIISTYNIEKIKTIGDSYMCAGGLPVVNKTNARDVVDAALEIQHFMNQLKEDREKKDKHSFEIRIGIHSGPVVAGIVGIKKFAYDIWGDTVNIASRMESSGEAGKVNISGATYELVKEKFNCTYRGKIQAKNKGEIDMYFVDIVSNS